jgi:hypothetical protein
VNANYGLEILLNLKLFFSKGTLSGTLAFLAKRGDITRSKSAGNWVYTMKENGLKNLVDLVPR